LSKNHFYKGDCLEIMPRIPDRSIDMILCDMPYGTTACKWDTIIPLDRLWDQYKRIIKPKGAIVLTAQQPFTSVLVMSNPRMFRYSWVWRKERGVGFQIAKYRPMMETEDVTVFSVRTPNYYPQMTRLLKPRIESFAGSYSGSSPLAKLSKGIKMVTHRYPKNILEFSRDKPRLHPTQKPVDLFEYLIKTYTNEGETVLDNCAGSGTTAIACLNTGRKFILIEQDDHYCEIALRRIREFKEKLKK
jgi:site-specific DNA-methyltransferase (adenine-specific)